MRCVVLGVISGLIWIAGCSPSETTVESAGVVENSLISQGKELVQANCHSCHAIERSDDSRREDAPPLRTVLANMDPESLAMDFREGIHVGAADMPDFDFGPIGTDAVIAYLQSIQEQPFDGASDDQG